MSTINTGVLEKLRAALPNQIGANARWTESTVKAIIIAADRATRDKCEVHYATAEITLTNDTVSYDVPPNFITINKVEFSLDGTNYDWFVRNKSLTDLDRVSHTWRNDNGARPDFYGLLSAIGVQDNGNGGSVPSQILLYPHLLTAGSAKIRLTGVMVPAVGAHLVAKMPEDVQSKCHVPYVLSVLYAVSAPKRSAEYYQKFLQGCESVMSRFRSQYKDNPSRPGRSQYERNWTRT